MKSYTDHHQQDAPPHSRVFKVPDDVDPERAASDAKTVAFQCDEDTLLCYRGYQILILPGEPNNSVIQKVKSQVES